MSSHSSSSSSFQSTVTHLPSLPSYQLLSSRVTSILGHNPGPYSLQGTNTYLIGTGQKRILLDTGDDSSMSNGKYIENLRATMKGVGCEEIQEILITHWHHDHTGGIHDILQYIAASTSASTHQQQQPIRISKYKPHIRGTVPDYIQYTSINAAASLDEALQQYHHKNTSADTTAHSSSGSNKYTIFSTEGATLIPIYTPGHTTDHLIFYLLEDRVVFSGDTVLGNGSAVFANLGTYMNSLDTIVQCQPSVIYPAHGEIIHDGTKRVQQYIDHRKQREREILQILQADRTKRYHVTEIVKSIYNDISDRLLPAAMNNVLLHLEKLCIERCVRALRDSDGDEVDIGSDHIEQHSDHDDYSDDMGKKRIAEYSQWYWQYIDSGNEKNQNGIHSSSL